MTTPALFSETNVQNSVSGVVAQWLLTNGYLVYWHELDGVETPDGFYGSYTAQQAALAADVAFAARLAGAKGLATLRGRLTANPRFVTRPSSSGHVVDQAAVPIPAFAVDIGTSGVVSNYEVGSTRKWRGRRLTIAGLARSDAEQTQFADALAVVFDADTIIDVRDHDSGSLALVGSVRVLRPLVEHTIAIDGPEDTTYAVELNARLEYVA